MLKFKQFLLELLQTESTLTSSVEFKKFQATDSTFADKLLKAWEGDMRDYKRDPKKFDPLFPRMLSKEAIAKLSPSSVKFQAETKRLLELFSKVFKGHVLASSQGETIKKSTDLWWHAGKR